MTTDQDFKWHEDLILPVLLGEARKAYGQAIKRRLEAAGFDDVPRLGPRVLGGIAKYGGRVGDMAKAFGVSKQAASKLVDALVSRGYLDRLPDPDDRRRIELALTERGKLAAREIAAAARAVDAALEKRIGADEVARMRVALGALVELRAQPAG